MIALGCFSVYPLEWETIIGSCSFYLYWKDYAGQRGFCHLFFFFSNRQHLLLADEITDTFKERLENRSGKNLHPPQRGGSIGSVSSAVVCSHVDFPLTSSYFQAPSGKERGTAASILQTKWKWSKFSKVGSSQEAEFYILLEIWKVNQRKSCRAVSPDASSFSFLTCINSLKWPAQPRCPRSLTMNP